MYTRVQQDFAAVGDPLLVVIRWNQLKLANHIIHRSVISHLLCIYVNLCANWGGETKYPGRHVSLWQTCRTYCIRDICAGKYASIEICVRGDNELKETRIPATPATAFLKSGHIYVHTTCTHIIVHMISVKKYLA